MLSHNFQANADEEIMTPVRRSSRIRNHHATAVAAE